MYYEHAVDTELGEIPSHRCFLNFKDTKFGGFVAPCGYIKHVRRGGDYKVQHLMLTWTEKESNGRLDKGST
jgi:hypothetical protein